MAVAVVAVPAQLTASSNESPRSYKTRRLVPRVRILIFETYLAWKEGRRHAVAGTLLHFLS